MKWTRGQKGDKQKDGDDEKRIHNQAENCCHRYFMLFHSEINKFIAEDCLKRLMLTLLSRDVGLVPVLGGVLDKLDIHLNVWITICLDRGDRKNDNRRGHKHSVR